MLNPIATAVKGKGFLPLVERGRTIISRYGLTGAGISQSLVLLADMLDQFKCSGTFPITVMPLTRHKGIVKSLQARGLEFAVHGLVHVDYSQLAPDVQLDHLRSAQRIFEQAGLHPTGFRCPYLRWNADTLAALRQCGFIYDSSQALAWDFNISQHADAYQHVLEFYGAQFASEYPSLPRFSDGLVRINYCLPDDEALVERLKLTEGKAMAEIWLAMLDSIYQAGELFTIGLHPERFSLCQEALQAVLSKARSLFPAVWIARLEEISTWWRALRQSIFHVHEEANDLFRIEVQAPSEAEIVFCSVDVISSAQSQARESQQLWSHEFTIRSHQRPFIGVSPDSSPALFDFLTQQGYLVELSPDSQIYPIYLHQPQFAPKDERPLLKKLMNGSWPSVRLARWPRGAQCAVAITGDIDAFTVWDYGLRSIGY